MKPDRARRECIEEETCDWREIKNVAGECEHCPFFQVPSERVDNTCITKQCGENEIPAEKGDFHIHHLLVKIQK